MKKPSLHATKWLGDIPVEGECTSCPDVKFDAASVSHRPNREEYQQSLQRQFDIHFLKVHMREDASQAAARKS